MMRLMMITQSCKTDDDLQYDDVDYNDYDGDDDNDDEMIIKTIIDDNYNYLISR